MTAQPVSAPQLVVASAVPGESGETISITGRNFGARPFVTLDLIPLTVRTAIDTEIIAAAPVREMPAGEYLLTVSRGPTPAESGSFQLALGGGGSKRSASTGVTRVQEPAQAVPADSRGSPLAASDEPAAKVGDRVITIADLDREWQRTDPASHIALSRELYDNRRRALEAMVADDLLAREAAARSMSIEALLNEEIPKHTITMPESAAISLYRSLGDRTRGASLDQMRPALRAWLERITQPELAKMAYVEELTKVSTRVDTLLVAPRVQIERTAQDVTFGPSTAPVEIVAFGDFQSPAYAMYAQAFGKVRDTFGDRVRLVFKNLPALGPESIAAAEAAACANAQGKFWAYHDALVTRSESLTMLRLQQSATAVGVNRDAFDACVDEGTFRGVIRQAVDEAGRYGLQASPSFLVNGRLAPEPPPFLPPFDFFKRIIEEELSHQATGR